MNLTAIRERIAVDAIRWAPRGLFSVAVGWGARRTLPRRLRPPVYRVFARCVGAQLDEAELPLNMYPSLGDFFARRLRSGTRPINDVPDNVICPCDGVVAASGVASDGHLIQAKGKSYSLAGLLGDADRAERFRGGAYVTIYLSPRDYHRVHSPIRAKLLGYRHIPGTRFPVNPLFSRSIDQLMVQNERVVFHLQTDIGAACLVMVAALGVSNIEVAHDRIETRYLRPNRVPTDVRFEEPIDILRGEELGAFRLGSTTIAIFEPKSITLEQLGVGEALRFGQPIGQVARSEPVAASV